jgi:hypothetical protein
MPGIAASNGLAIVQLLACSFAYVYELPGKSSFFQRNLASLDVQSLQAHPRPSNHRLAATVCMLRLNVFPSLACFCLAHQAWTGI